MPVGKETGTSATHRLLIDLCPIAQDFAQNVLAECGQFQKRHSVHTNFSRMFLFHVQSRDLQLLR